MATRSFPEARAIVVERLAAARAEGAARRVEEVPLAEAAGRVLAEDVAADRDYPAVARSIRDGYAVRAADLPGLLRVIGEVRAGETYPGEVGAGEAVEIMTGAPVPGGATQVVMVEHAHRDGASITTPRAPSPGEFINPQGAEIRRGASILHAGQRLTHAGIAALASVGRTTVRVRAKPRVAILSTGDEVVDIGRVPRDNQVRNSNAWMLAAQVAAAGGCPVLLPVAPDELERTRDAVTEGLSHDLLLLSGGVSAGKHDYVEPALAALGAEFYFDRVLIQPGQPLVFGRARGVFFFGLPGNPASTMVTFELFARTAVEMLGGARESSLRMPLARLTADFRHAPGLTRVLPARLSADASEVTPERWQGSSDVAALARADSFLVAAPDREHWTAGELIRVLLR